MSMSEAQEKYRVYQTKFVDKAAPDFFQEHSEQAWFKDYWHPIHLMDVQKTKDLVHANHAMFHRHFAEKGNVLFPLFFDDHHDKTPRKRE